MADHPHQRDRRGFSQRDDYDGRSRSRRSRSPAPELAREIRELRRENKTTKEELRKQNEKTGRLEQEVERIKVREKSRRVIYKTFDETRPPSVRGSRGHTPPPPREAYHDPFEPPAPMLGYGATFEGIPFHFNHGEDTPRPLLGHGTKFNGTPRLNYGGDTPGPLLGLGTKFNGTPRLDYGGDTPGPLLGHNAKFNGISPFDRGESEHGDILLRPGEVVPGTPYIGADGFQHTVLADPESDDEHEVQNQDDSLENIEAGDGDGDGDGDGCTICGTRAEPKPGHSNTTCRFSCCCLPEHRSQENHNRKDCPIMCDFEPCVGRKPHTMMECYRRCAICGVENKEDWSEKYQVWMDHCGVTCLERKCSCRRRGHFQHDCPRICEVRGCEKNGCRKHCYRCGQFVRGLYDRDTKNDHTSHHPHTKVGHDLFYCYWCQSDYSFGCACQCGPLSGYRVGDIQENIQESIQGNDPEEFRGRQERGHRFGTSQSAEEECSLEDAAFQSGDLEEDAMDGVAVIAEEEDDLTNLNGE